MCVRSSRLEKRVYDGEETGRTGPVPVMLPPGLPSGFRRPSKNRGRRWGNSILGMGNSGQQQVRENPPGLIGSRSLREASANRSIGERGFSTPAAPAGAAQWAGTHRTSDFVLRLPAPPPPPPCESSGRAHSG